jgi:hypothetical protein
MELTVVVYFVNYLTLISFPRFCAHTFAFDSIDVNYQRELGLDKTIHTASGENRVGRFDR